METLNKSRYRFAQRIEVEIGDNEFEWWDL
jgi:hypothetical protein